MSTAKAWTVRLVSLLVFNLVVLVLIIWLVPSVHGRPFALLWAAVILTLATVWIKPALARAASGSARKVGQGRTPGAQRAFSYLAVFLVAFVIWLLTVWLTQVRVYGWFWGYVIPPLALLVAWFVYDLIDEKLEAQAGRLYDAADRRIGKDRPPQA